MKKVLIAALFVALSGIAQAATVTSGTVVEVGRTNGSYDRVSLAWTSDASGNVVAVLDTALVGELKRVAIASDDGATSPTNLYDIVINDAVGIDVLQGGGGNWVTATDGDIVPGIKSSDYATTATTALVPVFVFAPLTLKITNAGATKGGDIELTVKR